jgi:ABC-type branched-subunit amino acid transport system ATPase component
MTHRREIRISQSTELTDGPGQAVLEVRAARAGYATAEVLHGIDLEVGAGSILALVGANGAGKSTLCAVLAGLIPVTAGLVILDGEDITRLPAHKRAGRGLLMIPETRGIFPSVTVEDNLAVWLRAKSQRDAVYDRFPNLAVRRKVLAGDLSGGEQQMLSLGPMFARPPTILIADEPTLGLSPTVSEQVVRALSDIQSEGTALLLVEEKTTYALRLASRVGLLAQGHLQWVRDTAEVREHDVAAAYLGSTIPDAL